MDTTFEISSTSSSGCPYAFGDTAERRTSFDSEGSNHTNETDKSRTPLQSSSTSQQSLPALTGKTCPAAAAFTQEIDPVLLKVSLEDRMAYLTDFLNFTSRDAEVITKIAPAVEGMIPTLVDEIYAKLFEFDITKKVFMNRNQVSPQWRRRIASSPVNLRNTRASMVPYPKSWRILH